MQYSIKNMKNAYWWPDINFFLKITKIEISSHSLTHSLPDDSRKPRAQMKQRMATILRHNNKLTSEMPFGVWDLCTSLFLLSSIRLFYFFMQRNHIDVLIFQSTLSLSSVSRLILKHLCYSRGIG